MEPRNLLISYSNPIQKIATFLLFGYMGINMDLMSPEIPHPDLNKDDKPWQRLIKCGPGDNEEIKKAGEEARKIGPGVIGEVIMTSSHNLTVGVSSPSAS